MQKQDGPKFLGWVIEREYKDGKGQTKRKAVSGVFQTLAGATSFLALYHKTNTDHDAYIVQKFKSGRHKEPML